MTPWIILFICYTYLPSIFSFLRGKGEKLLEAKQKPWGNGLSCLDYRVRKKCKKLPLLKNQETLHNNLLFPLLFKNQDIRHWEMVESVVCIRSCLAGSGALASLTVILALMAASFSWAAVRSEVALLNAWRLGSTSQNTS